jgi:RNA polymerase sigma-70 factor (ECF subfamily)
MMRRPTFVTTHWSVVLKAGHTDTPRARDALARLCQTYWYPLYAHVRRRGYSQHDAEDLTQEFFARLLASDFIAQASRERGRFRSFLLTALGHFLADEWDRIRAQKRGGDRQIIPLEVETAETRYRLEPADHLTPEKAYERRWARTLLAHVVGQLRHEYEEGGKAELFDGLKGCLTLARSGVPYAELAGQLNMGEGALRVAVHRLRQRYRELLRAEIANTVADPGEVEEELRHLFSVLAG